MLMLAAIAAQRWDTVRNRITAHSAIKKLAFHFARRLTHPPRAQSRSMGPNRRWYQSHSCRRGELRAAAQAAIRMNTVVGKPGTKIPMTPRARQRTANACSSQPTARGTGGSVGGGGIPVAGGWSSFISVGTMRESILANWQGTMG